MDKLKIYFPNLNSLRFIAAMMVLFPHIEQFKSICHIQNNLGSCRMKLGTIGVILFFVLSGFLITYLLLTEENIQKRISIKAFYLRRILRIWPLYFLIILLSLWILPNINIFILPGYGKDIVYKDLILKIILYIVFFPNLVLSLLGFVPYASQTWSIGTEEQYYLVWPIILKYFKKYRIALMVFIIISYLLIAKILTTHYSDFIPYKHVITAFWSTFNIDCMAIGGIFAILLFQRSKSLKIFMNTYLFYGVIVLTCILMFKGIFIPYYPYELYAFLFGIIILNFAANSTIRISLENNIFNYLGKISYGLYMYHPICIVLSLKLAIYFQFTSNWLLYPLSAFLTILTASISYKYFESKFLRLKNRFSNIVSGDNSKLLTNSS
jgi:peptidoglycan/LPS O-acetylase OafA/YrhL